MIKTITIPTNNNYNLAIPTNYLGKKIEIIVYALDEVTEEKNSSNVKLSDKYKGIISKEEGESLQNHIKQMRNEWNNI